MKVQVYLEPGESQADADAFFAKAAKKHEHQHVERFEDPLIQELLGEVDAYVTNDVLLAGFEDVLSSLLAAHTSDASTSSNT